MRFRLGKHMPFLALDLGGLNLFRVLASLQSHSISGYPILNAPCLIMQDGRVICSSTPTYGQGTEPGNEAGYIVGMSTCYPEPGSVRIADGETLYLDSNYSSSQRHTGVMGLFYILVAEPLPNSKSYLQAAVEVRLYSTFAISQP